MSDHEHHGRPSATLRPGQPGHDETDPAVRVVDADPTWPARFAAEAAQIRAALGPVALRVDHVGSTAVPGLAAKPIIDIQVSVARLQPMDSYRPALERLGYRYTPYPDPDGVVRYPFFGRPPTRPRAFHVHVTGDRPAYMAAKQAFVDDLERRALNWSGQDATPEA
jgi:GrpB-like predicted nucleotidyltransferase (UPF0157 family)